MKASIFCISLLVLGVFVSSTAIAQSVCLPAPRLLTTMPMGGQVGTNLEVNITGDNLDGLVRLRFSHPGITATAKLDENKQPIANKFVVSIAKDCPAGIHEARVMTRLGISSSRVFNVGNLPETTQDTANTSLKTAKPLQLNSICNAVMTKQAIDYYSFEAGQGQRIVVDCAAKGIDSKFKPVLIIADENGADLVVDRRGGALDFTAPKTGMYTIKVHELTYNGGPHFFYRLAVRVAAAGKTVLRLPSTQNVNSFSWPPHGLTDDQLTPEVEPNNHHAQAHKITLPCDISGSFFPAADVDTFEFTAKKGETWWVEVASERLGLSTDPAIVVQHVGSDGTLSDVREFNDIASPMKVSSNGYSYDGPPYNAGSTDIIGQLVIKQDGVHRLQLRDLFGGTRNDPRNIYRMIIRKANPDFALVGWALHMGIRNGDRNALSKPIALRGGTTMAFEIVRVGRDGFGEEIELFMEGLPEGVSAAGVKIPAGQSRGILLITADQKAPRGIASATIYGKCLLNGKVTKRRCHLASMQWPVPDASQQIPAPRLLADIPVSVSGSELAPITISPSENKIWEASVGDKLTIPLVHSRRCEFSGANISLKTWGCGIGKIPAFDAPLNADTSQATLDLAALKTPAGDYVIAFYGSAVAKYRYHPEAVAEAKDLVDAAKQEVAKLTTRHKELAEVAKTATSNAKAAAEKEANDAAEKQKVAVATVTKATEHLKAVTAKAQQKDIVDIVVSTPITIRVKPADKATQE